MPKTVDIRSFVIFAPVATQISPTQIIYVYNDDVGMSVFFGIAKRANRIWQSHSYQCETSEVHIKFRFFRNGNLDFRAQCARAP